MGDTMGLESALDNSYRKIGGITLDEYLRKITILNKKLTEEIGVHEAYIENGEIIVEVFPDRKIPKERMERYKTLADSVNLELNITEMSETYEEHVKREFAELMFKRLRPGIVYSLVEKEQEQHY
jgi:hypothetical protein